MNRTAKAIHMLEILQACGKVSKKELASRLNTNERNIYELKKELIEAGYRFIELKGRNSGYELDKQYLLKMPQLTVDQKEALKTLTAQVMKDTQFIGHQDTQDALIRVCSMFEKNHEEMKLLYATTVNKAANREDLQDLYTKINYAIRERYSVEVFYESYYSSRLRKINPYDLFKVDREWYWIGYDFEANMFKLYRLDRIKSVQVSDEKFWFDPKYKRVDFVDEYGLKNIGEAIRVELQVHGPYKKTLMENPVGMDVSIDESQDGSIIYEATIRGDYKISELVLKMGQYCKVLGPSDLRDKIVEELMVISRSYGLN